jgi:transposase
VSGHLFVFGNRRRNRLKVLVWDGSGLWVLAKRLERGTFAWPESPNGSGRLAVQHDELAALLGGLDLSRARRRDWYRRAPQESSIEPREKSLSNPPRA